MRYCPFPEAFLILARRRKLLEMWVQQEIIEEKIIYLDCREMRWESQGVERRQRENSLQKIEQLTVHRQKRLCRKLYIFAIKVYYKHVTVLRNPSNFLRWFVFQMFSYRRLVPTLKSCLLSGARPVASTSNVVQRRGLVSSVPRRAEPSPVTPVEGEGGEEQVSNNDMDTNLSNLMTQGDETGPASYRQFLEEIGYKYKFASPQQWLGNEVVESVS